MGSQSYIHKSGYSKAFFSQNVTRAPVVLGLCRPSIPVRSHSRSLSAQFANWHISAHSLDSSLIMHPRFFVVIVGFFFFPNWINSPLKFPFSFAFCWARRAAQLARIRIHRFDGFMHIDYVSLSPTKWPFQPIYRWYRRRKKAWRGRAAWETCIKTCCMSTENSGDERAAWRSFDVVGNFGTGQTFRKRLSVVTRLTNSSVSSKHL